VSGGVTGRRSDDSSLEPSPFLLRQRIDK